MKLIKAVPVHQIPLETLPEKYRSEESLISMGLDTIAFNNPVEVIIPMNTASGEPNFALLTEAEYWELFRFFAVSKVYEKADPVLPKVPRKIEIAGLSDFLKVMRLTLESRRQSFVDIRAEGDEVKLPADWDSVVDSNGYMIVVGEPLPSLQKIKAIKFHRQIFDTPLMDSQKAIENGFEARIPSEDFDHIRSKFAEYGVNVWAKTTGSSRKATQL